MVYKNKTFLIVFILVFLHFSLFSLSLMVRSFDHQGYSRIVFEGDESFTYQLKKREKKIILVLDSKVKSVMTEFLQKDSAIIDKVIYKSGEKQTHFEICIKKGCKLQQNFVLENPFRLVFDISANNTRIVKASKKNNDTFSPGIEKKPVEYNKQQKEENFKPKNRTTIETICLDPGHGGNDIGAEGKSGLMEKNITLDICNKLKKVISTKLGIDVLLTRKSDTAISLNQRAALANNEKAQLFISIHVNGSYRKSARGPEIYFASLKATDNAAFQLAQRENESVGEIGEKAENDALKMILWNMAQTEYIKESSILAEYMQEELNILLGTRNRGVKQAPFRVLMRAAMPAILIEVAFITNRGEEKKLGSEDFLHKIAGSIYNGIFKYINYYNSKFSQ